MAINAIRNDTLELNGLKLQREAKRAERDALNVPTVEQKFTDSVTELKKSGKKVDQKKLRKAQKESLDRKIVVNEIKILNTRISDLEAEIADKKKESVDPFVRAFQVDNGVKPMSGSVSWRMLDDEFSTAFEKTQEFVRLIKDEVDFAVNGVIKKLRVVEFESFLNGDNGIYKFKRIVVLNYRTVANVNGLEGEIQCEFDFEQFELTTDQDGYADPVTKVSQTIDGGVELPPLKTAPPLFTTFETGIPEETA